MTYFQCPWTWERTMEEKNGADKRLSSVCTRSEGQVGQSSLWDQTSGKSNEMENMIKQTTVVKVVKDIGSGDWGICFRKQEH